MNGLICPKCKSPISSVKATKVSDKNVKRRRVCDNGHEFETQERITGIHKRERVRPKALVLLVRSELPSTNPHYLSVPQIAETLGVSVATLYRIKRGDRSVRQVKIKTKGKAKEPQTQASLISKPRKDEQNDQDPSPEKRS